ncbi:uncharacterized protein BDZ99DRAFT_527493 [Mytilinidion resinicola]|uniref:Uncharacterized protein n=1 Tax=Mytilinidion resinicola TaxID=574789 RepID=A0A6A6Y2M6_9PEZI|nr:uncharacterized protein BDZ99DRAFT_527493 [Mytilinidion resinicola]KAF2802465.1 hypothetical protein BDZ99DRAFT_527493 [Mytilinidion resinicola]
MPTSANSTATSTEPSTSSFTEPHQYLATCILFLTIAYFLGRYNAMGNFFRAAFRLLRYIIIFIQRRPFLLVFTPAMILWLYFHLTDRDGVLLYRSDREWLAEVEHASNRLWDAFCQGLREGCERRCGREEGR